MRFRQKQQQSNKFNCVFAQNSEDLFITSKLWNTFHRPDLVRPALETTLKNLNTSYVDLYLIHWPFAYKEEGELFPKDANDQIAFSSVDFVDTWHALEELVDAGLAKSIGLSNFNKAQTQRVLDNSRIRPAVNQIECHPYLTQQKLSAYLKSVGIVVTAYSPLGSPNRPWVTKDDPVLLEDPKVRCELICHSEKLHVAQMNHSELLHPQITSLAKKYNKTSAQILIRYQLQRGHAVIPKSVTKERIISNAQVFDFELTADDLALINSFECNGRICPMSG